MFWLAYTGSAMARLFTPRLAGLARHSRDFGLAFASAQVVHVGLVLWLFYLAPGSNGGMVFFWVGILCTYLLALFSLPRLRDALGPLLWRISCTMAMEYIALVFAFDFIRIPLQANGLGKTTALPVLPAAPMTRIIASWPSARTDGSDSSRARFFAAKVRARPRWPARTAARREWRRPRPRP